MKIKKIQKNKDKVFTVDVEVEDTHTYQLENGVVVHNSTSCVLGTASGIHARYAPYYNRRVRYGKTEAVTRYLMKTIPELIEEDALSLENVVLSIPQKSPENSVFRDEGVMETLERVTFFNKNWIASTTNRGENNHNVSCTISVQDGEWDIVGNWMWDNKNAYNGIAVLPYDGGKYIQAPFEEITEEEYNTMYDKLKNIRIEDILEDEDVTAHREEVACSGGACEITQL